MEYQQLIEETFEVLRNTQNIASSDPFYEVLKQFLRSSQAVERNSTDINDELSELNTLSQEVWQRRECSMNLQGVCGDKNNVSLQHVYTVEEYNGSKLSECSSSCQKVISTSKEVSDAVFDTVVAICRVESELVSMLNGMKQNNNDFASGERVMQILGVLFRLLRTCNPSDQFSNSIIRWIFIFVLNSIYSTDPADSCLDKSRLLVLFHILRVQNGFVSKLTSLVQPPILKPAFNPANFQHFKGLYLSMLKTVVTKPTYV